MIVGSLWSSLSLGLDGSRYSQELVSAFIRLFIWCFSLLPNDKHPPLGSTRPWIYADIFLSAFKCNCYIVKGWCGRDRIRAICSVFLPAEPAVRCARGRRRHFGLCRSGNDFCLPALLQNRSAGKWCWPSLYPGFPIFCPIWATPLCTRVIRWELVQTGREAGSRLPAYPVKVCGFRRAGLALLQDGRVPLQHHPLPSAQ